MRTKRIHGKRSKRTKKFGNSVQNPQWQNAQEKNLESDYTPLQTVYFVKCPKQIVFRQNFRKVYKHMFKTRIRGGVYAVFSSLFNILNRVLNIFEHKKDILFV